MNKLYDMIIWNNNTTPALNEDNLNAMSQAINDIDDRVVALGSDVLTVIPQIQAYLDQAEDLVEAMEALSQNPPYIGANGNWWVWDIEEQEFVDSGIDASITVTIADVTAIAPDATPYITNTGTNTDPIFHLFIPRGQTGAAGQDGDDGVSPDVEVTTITGGHRVTITDADHPGGQSFDVMDGTGNGDMQASVYDPQSVVANAGGIPNYAAGLTDLAPAFSDQTAYAVGEYVSYQGAIYRFVAAHSAGAWSSSDVLEVAVCSDLKNKVNGIEAELLIDPDYPTSSDSGIVKKTDGHITAKVSDVYLSSGSYSSYGWAHRSVGIRKNTASDNTTTASFYLYWYRNLPSENFTANTIKTLTVDHLPSTSNSFKVFTSAGDIRLVDMSISSSVLTVRLISPVTQTANVRIMIIA